jgi:hypothetical protein
MDNNFKELPYYKKIPLKKDLLMEYYLNRIKLLIFYINNC